ncbi:7-cyano-7-deazaguanine synthase QueC [Halorhodospira abdelmalekii]|uniref:7-cyano-7-deazaguanine synthase QueC n=1 Tax=Halorhodospira abdelmalekii TaxID=421629 RepID=UPI001907E30E|nr:7-cyano-7-deazaguanine synthase QueC [Halorhodospira abdelmalekii]MBK1735473.1 7-cyano-7-deazaguanine synthase QueC [Halorhodospira abdelmalekii]
MTIAAHPADYTAALVLFSGGQDSTTTLAWALDRFARVETVGFEYGQRHHAELAAREAVRHHLAERFPLWSPRLGADHLLDAGVLGTLSETALTSAQAIAYDTQGLPNTYVPGRNLLFFTLSAALAERRGIRHLISGVCETDYSGYPDCRDDTIKAVQVALNLGMAQRFVLHTPLMWIDKAATWQLAEQLGGNPLLEVIIEHTHTCYQGERQHRLPWGYGCNDCPACRLRAEGWQRFHSGGGGQKAERGEDPSTIRECKQQG